MQLVCQEVAKNRLDKEEEVRISYWVGGWGNFITFAA